MSLITRSGRLTTFKQYKLKTAGGVIRLKASSISSIAPDADLEIWENIAPGAIVNADMPTPVNRPLYVLDSGQPAVRFNGSSHYMSFGDNFDLGTNSFSVFVVARRIISNGVFIGKTHISDPGSKWAAGVSGSQFIGGQVEITGTTYSTNVAIPVETDYVLFEVHMDRASGKLSFYLDTALIDEESFTPDTTTVENSAFECAVGRYGSTAGRYLGGSIKEIFVAQSPGVVSGNALIQNRQYFKQEYQLTGY